MKVECTTSRNALGLLPSVWSLCDTNCRNTMKEAFKQSFVKPGIPRFDVDALLMRTTCSVCSGLKFITPMFSLVFK